MTSKTIRIGQNKPLIPRQEHQENNVIADLIWIYADKSLIL